MTLEMHHEHPPCPVCTREREILTVFVDLAEKMYADWIAQGATIPLNAEGTITLADARAVLGRGVQ